MYGTANQLTSSSISNISTKLSSNVSFNKKFTGTPFNLAVNMSHLAGSCNKALSTLSAPTITFNMANQYPFQRKAAAAAESRRVLDNFSVSYAMNASNRITNNLGRLTETATTGQHRAVHAW